MEQAEDSSVEVLWSRPYRGIAYTVLISALIGGGMAVADYFAKNNRTTPQQALVERCIGTDTDSTGYHAFAATLLDDFASKNGWRYDPNSEKIYKGNAPVNQDNIAEASSKYVCTIRRTQHR